MAEKKIGTCSFCGEEFSKVTLKNHFKKCEKNKKIGGEKEDFFLIEVEGAYDSRYWLYISVKATATLKDIDKFLRDIWLECCGHLSSFSISGEEYESSKNDMYPVKTMGIKLENILEPGLTFNHDYDFGDTTTLKLKVVSEYSDINRKKKVELLARNVAPVIKCEHCDNLATNICLECEEWLCDDCFEEHECDEEMSLPVVNSPRTGVCGYEG